MNIKKFDKKNLLVGIFFIIMLILSLLAKICSNYYYSLIMISFWVFMINFMMKKNINKRVTIYIYIYILLNIFMILLVTSQARDLGFSTGVLHGNVKGVLYNDANNYYNNVLNNYNINIFEYLKNFFLNIRSDNYMYNLYILYNLMISKIFGVNIEILLIAKLAFCVVSLNLLAKICNILNVKRMFLVVFLYSIYPGFLSININFIRDIMIVTVILFIMYSYLKLIKFKGNKKKNIFFIILGMFILSLLRLYTSVTLGICLFIFMKSKNIKSLIFKFILSIICLLVINKLSIIFGYGFLGMQYINSYVNGLGYFNALIQTVLRILVGYSIVIEALKSGVWSNVFTMISPIYIFIVNLLVIALIALKSIRLNFLNRKILLFYIMFAFLNGLILLLRDGIIVERIYTMWIWLPIIVLADFKNNIIRNYKVN
ncbi:hypothetical protein GNF80_04330 [Clostridium perfringens]|nr:hypothetical protein [Clostridium perfringens]